MKLYYWNFLLPFCFAVIAQASTLKLVKPAKVYKGTGGEIITVIKVETDSVVKKPHLLKISDEGGEFDGKIFEVNIEGGKDKSDYVINVDGKRYVVITQRESFQRNAEGKKIGEFKYHPPKGEGIDLMYSEEASKKVDIKKIQSEFEAKK